MIKAAREKPRQQRKFDSYLKKKIGVWESANREKTTTDEQKAKERSLKQRFA